MRALIAMTLGCLLLLGVGRAAADYDCVQDAKDLRGQCRMECDDDFVISRDLCRNIDPECAAGCRTELAACRAPIVTALEQCVDSCRDQVNAARAACPKRGRGRDFCMDRANIHAFLCRDECRDDLQVHEGLKACRQGFNGCMRGCGIPTAPAPTATPTETPQPTRTATPKPEPTLTPVVPR